MEKLRKEFGFNSSFEVVRITSGLLDVLNVHVKLDLLCKGKSKCTVSNPFIKMKNRCKIKNDKLIATILIEDYEAALSDIRDCVGQWAKQKGFDEDEIELLQLITRCRIIEIICRNRESKYYSTSEICGDCDNIEELTERVYDYMGPIINPAPLIEARSKKLEDYLGDDTSFGVEHEFGASDERGIIRIRMNLFCQYKTLALLYPQSVAKDTARFHNGELTLRLNWLECVNFSELAEKVKIYAICVGFQPVDAVTLKLLTFCRLMDIEYTYMTPGYYMKSTIGIGCDTSKQLLDFLEYLKGECWDAEDLDSVRLPYEIFKDQRLYKIMEKHNKLTYMEIVNALQYAAIHLDTKNVFETFDKILEGKGLEDAI